jgi:ParB family transcriptional regulator, chromosome partitioning protein
MPKPTYQKLPVDQLQPNPFQPREKIKKESLDELIQSIKMHGVLEPLVVAKTPAGYQIIAGERRWRASREIGLTEVPVIIKITTPRKMLEMAIVENVQRVDLNPIERATAFQQLIRNHGFSISKVAERIGKSISYISNSLRLLTLPDAITDGLMGRQITEGHARALLGIKDEKAMIDCYKVILKEGASVRRAEELARAFNSETGFGSTKTGGKSAKVYNEQEKVWQNKIDTFFQMPTRLKVTRSRNQTRIAFILKGAPEKTQADLEKIMKLIEA